MREKLFSGLAVATAWAATMKLCCVLPGALALLGLSGAAGAFVAKWLAPALTASSVLFLGYSFHLLYVRRRGSRAGRVATWLSAATVAGVWIYRAFGS